MALPTTVERVPRHTPARLNARIRRQTEHRVAYYAQHPEAIGPRLQALEAEWDMERTLEANASSLILLGSILGALVNRRWFLFTGCCSAFLLQHAVQGWCPPVPLFRGAGVRTQREIDEERYALKALRGDFQPSAMSQARGPEAVRQLVAQVRRG